MDEINEGSTEDITLVFTDNNGIARTPSNVEYSIIDYFTGQKVLDTTNVTPDSSSIDITLSGEATQIINSLYAYELRLITFVYTYDENTIKTEEKMFKLINMAGIPIIEEAI